MRNANSSTDQILRTLEIRFQPEGTFFGASFEGWFLPDDTSLTFCEIYSRERYRIKVAIYGRKVENPEELARALCKAWFDGKGDSGFWRRVDLAKL